MRPTDTATVTTSTGSMPLSVLRPMPLLVALLLAVCGWSTVSLRASAAPCAPYTHNDGYLRMSGSDGGMAINSLDMNFRDSFSVEAWVWRDSGAASRGFFGAGDDGENGNKYLWIGVDNDKRLAFGWSDTLRSPGSLPSGQWKHVTLTYYWRWGLFNSQRDRKMYIDGSRVGEDSSDKNIEASQKVMVGRYRTGNHWQGRIDELYVFANVLTQAQISAHAVGNVADVSSLGMRLWLRFALGDTNTGQDSSGRGKHMSLYSGAAASWRAGDADGKCLAGYWAGFGIRRLSDQSIPVGSQAFFMVYQANNFGGPILSATPRQVKVRVTGSGALASFAPMTLTLPAPQGAVFTLMNDQPGPVAVALLDPSNGDSPIGVPALVTWVSVPDPSMQFVAGSVSSLRFFDTPAADNLVEYTPALQSMHLNYSSVVYARTTSVVMEASFLSGDRTVFHAFNGQDRGQVLNGVLTAPMSLEAAVTTWGQGVPCAMRGPGLLLWMTFNGGDTSNQLDGTLSTTQSTSFGMDRFARANHALRLQGGTIVQAPSSFASALPADRWSVSLWFRTNAGGQMALLGLADSALDQVHSVYLKAGAMGTRLHGVESVESSPTGTMFNDDRWHHLVWQASPTLGQQLWVDGAVLLQGAATSSSFSPVGMVRFGWGKVAPTTEAYFTGRMDDVAVWNRPLTPREIRAMQSAPDPVQPLQAHCVSIRSGNDAEGTIAGFEIVRSPWVMRSFAMRVGTGPGGDNTEDPLATYTLTPGINIANFKYEVGVGPYVTGISVTVGYEDPENNGLQVVFNRGVPVPVPSAPGVYLPPFMLRGGHVNTVDLVVSDGGYIFYITRPYAPVQGMQLKVLRAVDGGEEDYIPLMNPQFAAGVYRSYALTVPYTRPQMLLKFALPPGVAQLPLTHNGGAEFNLPADEWSAPIDLVFGDNIFLLAPGPDSITLTVLYQHPAVRSLAFDGIPAHTVMDPFVSGSVFDHNVTLHGVLTRLVMTVGVHIAPVNVTVNGVTLSPAVDNVPINLTPLLLSREENETRVVLSSIDGVYAYTFVASCPHDGGVWWFATDASHPCGPLSNYKVVACFLGKMRRTCMRM